MPAPLRFLDGISSKKSDTAMGNFPFLDPTDWRVWYEDWTVYDIAQTDTPEWTLTVTSVCPDTVPTPGSLLLTLADSGDDGQLQLDHGHFYLTSGKKAIFQTRIKIVEGTSGTIGQEGFVVGMSEVAVDSNFMDGPPPTAIAAADFWGFFSYDATTDIVAAQAEDDKYSTDVGCATYADDTWFTLSIYYDGTKSIFYKDDVEVAQLSGLEPTSVVAPVIFAGSGENKGKTFYCDYIFFANER